MCHKHGMTFDEVSRDYGIIQNPDDEFRGSEIVMLYDPGMFPALLESPNGKVEKSSRTDENEMAREILKYRE